MSRARLDQAYRIRGGRRDRGCLPIRLRWRPRRRQQRRHLQQRDQPVRRLEENCRGADHRHHAASCPTTERCTGDGRQRARTDDRARGQQGQLHLARLSHRHRRGQGCEGHLYLGRERRWRPAGCPGLRRRGGRRPRRGRSLGECRRRRDPQHRRQDRLPTRRKHAARQRFGKRGGRRLGCDTHRNGFNPAARRRLQRLRQRPTAWWWRRLPAPRATARGR